MPIATAPEAPSYEHQRAIMEGERNASLDAYSRVVYLTQTESRIYEAAFTNGWNRHAALVEAQQPTTHVQNPAEIEHVAGDVSKTGAESNMAQQPAPSVAAHKACKPDMLVNGGALKLALNVLRRAGKHEVADELEATAQPSTTPQADSQPAPEYVGNGMFKGETIQKAAEHWANWCDVRCMTGLSEFLRVVAARAPADSVLENAARYEYLRDCTMGERSRLEHYSGPALDVVIDAARKQGAPR